MARRVLVVASGVLVTVFTVVAILNYKNSIVVPSAASTSDHEISGVESLPARVAIGGRWKAVHASFGLPDLPDTIPLPDVETLENPLPDAPLSAQQSKPRRRSIFLPYTPNTKSPKLHFAPNSLKQPTLKIRDLQRFFRGQLTEQDETDATNPMNAAVRRRNLLSGGGGAGSVFVGGRGEERRLENDY
jgi:hypothetical protein